MSAVPQLAVVSASADNPTAAMAVQDQMLDEVAAEELRPSDLLVNLEAMSAEQRLAWARFLASF